MDRSAIWDHVSTLIIKASFNEDQSKEQFLHQYIHKASENFEDSEVITPYARYAILSHTWLRDKPGEVTYANWNSGKFDTTSPGYQKLANFCRITAAEHGINLDWMDTVCIINKESSAELDESICSMYKWYRDAHICVIYLAQTTTLQHMRDDSWFTRGWTLQELVAPCSSKFYDVHWHKLVPDVENNKDDGFVIKEIRAATNITAHEVSLLKDPHVLRTGDISVSRRMQWAANRQVTREEDIAYSLMGIFDVNMTIAYGEGSERAFLRLLQQTLGSSIQGVQDIANWGYGPDLKKSSPSIHYPSLIPSSPKQYLWRAEKRINWRLPTTPITLTHLGVYLPVLIMPAISANPTSPYARFDPIGSYHATVTIDKGTISGIELPSQRYNLGSTKLSCYRIFSQPTVWTLFCHMADVCGQEFN